MQAITQIMKKQEDAHSVDCEQLSISYEKE